MRKIVLDTETTGINKKGGPHYKDHKIIEIGAIEIINRKLTGNNFHVYLNPDRSIDLEAFNVHGISNNFLYNKPIFQEIVDKFIKFLNKSELIIHNAFFDVGFINYELSKINYKFENIEKFCKITDTLKIAKRMFPGKRNSLDALSQRYAIDVSQRNLHSALLDAKILANIFLLMTGGQTSINFSNTLCNVDKSFFFKRKEKKFNLKVLFANNKEKNLHKKKMDIIKNVKGKFLSKQYI